MRSETGFFVGDLVRFKRPRSVDDIWFTKTATKVGSRFDRILVPLGSTLLYVGRLSMDDEIGASYCDTPFGDEAGYTPIVPWGWCLLSKEKMLVAVNLSFVERV